MGQSTSKTTQYPEQTFSPEVQLIKKINMNHFGDVKLVLDKKTGREMHLKELVLNDMDTFNTQLAYYYSRINNPHPNLVNVIGYTTDHQESFCSQRHKINIFLDPLGKNLDTELETRILNREPYLETELQALTHDLFTILSEFQTKGIAHSDICPANIYGTNEAYKLCDSGFCNQKAASGLKKAFFFNKKPLLAPELLKLLVDGDTETDYNEYKADVFSFGVTLLSLATLTKPETLYDYKKGTINYDLMDARMKVAEENYSSTLVDLLRELLNPNPMARLDFIQLASRVNFTRTPSKATTEAPKRSGHISRKPVVSKLVFNKDTIVAAHPRKLAHQRTMTTYDGNSTAATSQSTRHLTQVKAGHQKNQYSVDTENFVGLESTQRSLRTVGDDATETYVMDDYSYGYLHYNDVKSPLRTMKHLHIYTSGIQKQPVYHFQD
jgi:serine/threonine protein kinase